MTQIFQPRLTYVVPEGWANYGDTPGNSLLVSPGGTLGGVNTTTSDFIGVYTSIAAAAGCDSTAPAEVATTPRGIAGWLRLGDSLQVPRTRPPVGELAGVFVDLRMARGWTKTCPYSHGAPVVP
jgi:hypothetical protein